MTTAGILAAVFGLILVACAVLPGPAQTLALDGVEAEPGGTGPGGAEPGDADIAGVSRTGLRAALAETVTDTDGVEAVRVRVGRRHADLRVRTELTDTAALRTAAVAAAERRLAQVGLARPLPVRVKVRTIRRRAAV